MWNAVNYRAFEAGLKAVLESVDGREIGDDDLCQMLINYVDERLEPYCHRINRDSATWHFRHHLGQDGRDSIADCVMEWAEDWVDDIRWPVAYVYNATGRLPGGYRENTTVLVVVEDRRHKIIGCDVIHWEEFAYIEDDATAYNRLHKAIQDCAISLGARSIFSFAHDGQLSSSKAIYHDAEQGPSIGRERDYGDPEELSEIWLRRFQAYGLITGEQANLVEPIPGEAISSAQLRPSSEAQSREPADGAESQEGSAT